MMTLCIGRKACSCQITQEKVSLTVVWTSNNDLDNRFWINMQRFSSIIVNWAARSSSLFTGLCQKNTCQNIQAVKNAQAAQQKIGYLT